MAERVCVCWREIVGVTLSRDLILTALDKREWKRIREELIPELESRVKSFERCSGISLTGVRSRIEHLKTDVRRYDFVRAFGDASAMVDEFVCDVARGMKIEG